MFVWGIDPGLSRCGYAVLDAGQPGAIGPSRRGSGGGRVPATSGPPSTTRTVALGVLRTDPDLDVPDRLAALAGDIGALLAEHPPAEVAVERILFSVNVRTAIGVAQAAGVVMALAAATGARVTEYSPNEIKQAVTGDGAADKAQVEAMVRRLLHIAEPIRPVDAADAAAIALCHLARGPMARRIAAARPGSSSTSTTAGTAGAHGLPAGVRIAHDPLGASSGETAAARALRAAGGAS